MWEKDKTKAVNCMIAFRDVFLTTSITTRISTIMTEFYATSKPIFEPKRKLKVICVGAGASGLLVAYKLQRHFDTFELNVYEKNEDVSGTW